MGVWGIFGVVKIKLTLLLFLCLFSSSLFSQGVSNLWLMGSEGATSHPWGGINMDFNGGILNMSYESRKMNINCTNGIISDKNGNRLFYTNGIWIANATNDTMLNGKGLNPSSFTTGHSFYGLTIPQANLIIPFPDDSTKYYLFHGTIDDENITYCSLHLYYSIIDMTLDNGKGAVIQKNSALLNDSLVSGRLTACKHANGRDWWIVVHQFHSNKYYKYLITTDGVQGPITQNIGAWRDTYFGQAVFSPDGKYFAYYEPFGDLDIFNFDRCTGDFSLKAHVDINDSVYSGGAAFSPNSQLLYISSESYVYQFDMNAANIAASKTTLLVWDGTYSPQPPLATTFYLSQLAPDGKIYINCGNSTDVLHVINNPDVLGIGCNACQHCVPLPALNAFTIANHPNYFLGAEQGSPCDTLTTFVSNLTKDEGINVYPNPFYDKVNLQMEEQANGFVKVYDMVGNVVYGTSTTLSVTSSASTSLNVTRKIELDLSFLSKGIYYISIGTKDKNFTGKIVKM